MEKFTIFEPIYNNDELEENFHKFFHINNLNNLFLNEHKAGHITVTDSDARSVVNNGGRYSIILKNFSDLLSIRNDEQMYDEATFKILKVANTFQKMMNVIKNILEAYATTKQEHLFNFWNIVFYNKDLF